MLEWFQIDVMKKIVLLKIVNNCDIHLPCRYVFVHTYFSFKFMLPIHIIMKDLVWYLHIFNLFDTVILFTPN